MPVETVQSQPHPFGYLFLELRIAADRPIGHDDAVEDHVAGAFRSHRKTAQDATITSAHARIWIGRLDAVGRRKKLQGTVCSRAFSPFNPDIIDNSSDKRSRGGGVDGSVRNRASAAVEI